ILEGLKDRYAEFHEVTYTDEAVRAAVELSNRYITDRFLPDKAIDLIDQAGARMSLARGPGVDVDALQRHLSELDAEHKSAVEAPDAQAARTAASEATIGEEEIARVVSRATGIPAARMTQSQKVRLANMEEVLHDRVVGQDEAVTSVSRAIRRSQTGMADPDRPIGSFLFLGPTGVGKTELAKALAQTLFDDESAMIRFDMSEFGE